jgi:hypothetical protein
MAVISLTGYEPRPRFDDKAWTQARIESTTDLENWVTVETITFEDPDEDPSDPKTRNFTTVIADPAITHLRVVFIDEDSNSDLTSPVPVVKPEALASVTDVQYRLGRELSEIEENQVSALLGMATVNIFNAVDKPIGWVPPIDVKRLFTVMCVELACRAMPNPQALGQVSETIGARSYTTTFARELPGSGIMPTDLEERILRRAVWGQNGGNARGYNDVLVSGLIDQRLREPMAWLDDE